jgi:translation initiation factor 2 alpha subunit (eIF-2alpha)
VELEVSAVAEVADLTLRSEKFNKKSVHFNISKDAHAAFRIACFERSLSMQEVFEEFVQRILAENPQMVKLLDQVAENKKNKSQKKFSKQDASSIFDLLEKEDPFK